MGHSAMCLVHSVRYYDHPYNSSDILDNVLEEFFCLAILLELLDDNDNSGDKDENDKEEEEKIRIGGHGRVFIFMWL
jgi:hypothetical protein